MADSEEAAAQNVDWEAIERTPDFQELVNGRRRFAWTYGTIGVGLGALYVVLAGVAPDLMGTQLFGSMSLGFAAETFILSILVGLAFAVAASANLLSHERGAERSYDELRVRAETGIGAA